MKTSSKIGLAALLLGTLGLGYYKYVRPAIYRTAVTLAPELSRTTEDSRNEGGLPLGEFHITTYNTPYEKYYDKWSTTGRKLGGVEACRVRNKGFAEAVMCQGSGIDLDGKLHSARSIQPTEKKSKGKAVDKCQYGFTSTGSCVKTGRSLAVDPSYIPYGTAVRLEFLDSKGKPCNTDICSKFNGWYTAEDMGGGIKGKDIDVYAGPETGRNQYLGKTLPSRANVYVANFPDYVPKEKILKERSPEVSKTNINPKKVSHRNSRNRGK